MGTGQHTTPVLFPVPTNTGISGRIVVVGGGMAGAAVAKYLRLWGGTGVSVTLVEASPSYTSNIMSNTVLTGQRTLASLNYSYDTLVSHYGVTPGQPPRCPASTRPTSTSRWTAAAPSATTAWCWRRAWTST